MLSTDEPQKDILHVSSNISENFQQFTFCKIETSLDFNLYVRMYNVHRCHIAKTTYEY